MSHFPHTELSTRHLLIRPFIDSDVDDIVASCSDRTARHFLRLPDPYTADDARVFIDKARRKWESGSAEWVIADPETNRYLGGIGLADVDRGRGSAEIGYVTAPWARGRGVAAEATIAVTDYLFANRIERSELRVVPENIPSQRVAIRAGYQKDGLLRSAAVGEQWRSDYLVYSRLPTDPPPPAPRYLPDLPSGRLTDGVVALDPFTPDDTDEYFALSALPEVWGTSMPPIPPDRAAIEQLCNHGAQMAWLAGQAARMAIRDAETGKLAGAMGVYRQGGPLPQVMLGYSLAREFRGRGFMSRAVGLAVDWSFDIVGAKRVVAGTASDNAASQAVLARAGFVKEGLERDRLLAPGGGFVDNVMWSILPKDR
ncbi:GNAT family N-acetyltransferase [Stackebrandtia soli]|uniref:GNAT family N-acetyltransferase n=1 Tax=Stackebrandtia soli TaxID=1892856 RepID=UPI0039EA7E53